MLNNRNIPLDILRGIVIFDMMFVDVIPFFGYYEGIFAHAKWQGATVADFAFPGFIFSMGAAAFFSLKKFKKYNNKVFFKKIFNRSLILFLLGILFNFIPSIMNFFSNFDFKFLTEEFNRLRIFGVLQRLALVYFFSAIIIKFINEKYLLIISFLLLFISSLFMHLYSTAPFLYEDNLNIFLDLFLVSDNHILIKNPPFEPEGFFGTIPSIAELLLGFYAMKLAEKREYRAQIFLGTSAIFLGGVWSIFDIISKPLWSSPYALLTAGFYIYLLLFITISVDKFKRNFSYLLALGRNPIFFYLASNFLLIFFSVNSIYFNIYHINELLPILCAFFWCVLWIPIANVLLKNDIKFKI